MSHVIKQFNLKAIPAAADEDRERMTDFKR